MKEIILIFLVSAITFVIFLIILIIGLVKKKKKLIISSIIIFFISLLAGVFGTIITTKKTYNKFSDLTKPRTGIEIYESVLGKPESECVEILNYQDPVILRIDSELLLHFKTCPKELKRILLRKDFQFERISTKYFNDEGNWFKPEKLGDSILVFKYYDDKGNGQEIYSSKDSTEVYLKDIAD